MAAKKKATAKKNKTERIPRYKDSDDQYLEIDSSGYIVKIGWYCPSDYDFGLMLANEHLSNVGADDTNIANEVCKKYVQEHGLPMPRKGGEFEFDSVRQAKECLRLINVQLHYMKAQRPLPEWAKQAFAAGFTAPKGWSP